MLNKAFITGFILIVFSMTYYPQNSRINGLGGLSYSINDNDYSLNLYDFGRNPAWLINDEQTTYLKISPSYNRQRGDYKRQYDFGSSDIYGVKFNGIKTLGEDGTFLGYTSYDYEKRKDVYRTLKYDSYAGEAFYSTDTTTGNFTYSGPAVGFMYSYQLSEGLYIGASIDYRILDGLKDRYSGAKSLLRNVNGLGGAAYKFSDNYSIGSYIQLFDNQESFEMKSLDGTDVEIFNYRGDNYRTSIRKTVLEQKVRKKGEGIFSQIYTRPYDNLEVAAIFNYCNSWTTILLPDGNIKESEEGYSSFENYNTKLIAKYHPVANLQLGGFICYKENRSWSKSSAHNLLLWDWEIRNFSIGAGASYYLSRYKLLIAAEAELCSVKLDSTKYIDNKFADKKSGDYILRLGAEYELLPETFLRAGYNYGSNETDLIYGGEDTKFNSFSLGVGINISSLTDIDFNINYAGLTPKSLINIFRDKLTVQASVKIYTF